MLKNLLFSVRDNIKKKTANPFLVTLLIVWLFRHYKELFKLMSSSENIGYDEKAKILDTLLKPEHLIVNVFQCIIIALIVLAITYFLLNISRLIINFFEKTVTPWVYKITDKSSVVMKDTYEAALNENQNIQNRFEEERDKRIKLEGEVSSLEQRIRTLISHNNLDNE